MTDFSVTFRGPGVEANTVGAAFLGSSLMALSELLEATDAVINGSDTEIWSPHYAMRVTSTAPGSFMVNLDLLQISATAVAGLLVSQPVSATLALRSLFGRDGLIPVMQWLNGRKPREILDAGERATFVLEDEEREVSLQIGTLYANKSVRRSMRKFIEPIGREDDIDSLTIDTPDNPVLLLTAADEIALSVPLDDDVITDEVVDMLLDVTRVSLESHKFQFRDSIRKDVIYAPIVDPAFVAKMDRGEAAFATGDQIRCKVRIVQSDIGEGGQPKAAYTVIEVLNHTRRPRQPQLDTE